MLGFENLKSEDGVWSSVADRFDLRRRMLANPGDPLIREEFLNAPIGILPISERSINSLTKKLGGSSSQPPIVKQVIELAMTEMLLTSRLGSQGIEEVQNALALFGLKLADVSPAPPKPERQTHRPSLEKTMECSIEGRGGGPCLSTGIPGKRWRRSLL